MKKWPHGNMGLIQYGYWEKVRPLSGRRLLPLYPLMRNWSEAEASKRDKYDAKYGRGHGNIEHNITLCYRTSKAKQQLGTKNQKSKSVKGAGSSKVTSEAPPYVETIMKRIDRLEEQNNLILTELALIPDRDAEKVIEALNKKGVLYKPSYGIASQGEEESEYQPRYARKDYFDGATGHYSNSDGNSKDDLSVEVDGFVTPERRIGSNKKEDGLGSGESEQSSHGAKFYNSSAYLSRFTGSKTDPIPIPTHLPETSSSTLSTNALASLKPKKGSIVEMDTRSLLSTSVDRVGTKSPKDSEEEKTVEKKNEGLPQKRPRKRSRYLASPYLPDSTNEKKKLQKHAGKTVAKALFTYTKELPDSQVEVAVTSVEELSKSKRLCTKKLFKCQELTLCAKTLLPIIGHQWLMDDAINAYLQHLSLRVGDDRVLTTTWRSHWLIELKAKGKPCYSKFNYQGNVESNAAVNRCLDIYFKRDKLFFPVNVCKNHFVTVVMHRSKKEFQVLDSLYDLIMYMNDIETLRAELAKDINEANTFMKIYPDVSNWPIKQYKIPRQRDGNSCGLWVLKCMEHWDGEKFTTEICQVDVDESRPAVVSEIILSPTNELQYVKDALLESAEEKEGVDQHQKLKDALRDSTEEKEKFD